MNIDPGKVYYMPLVVGPYFDINNPPRYVFEHMESLILQYRTDKDAIQDLLPDCYQVGKEPTVTIVFTQNDNMEDLAGRGYRIAGVLVSASFDGQVDHVEGNYVVVMFEDDTLPIIAGREQLGVPKVFADISPIRVLPGSERLRCEVSMWGHLLYRVDLPPLKEQNAIVRSVANRRKMPPYLCYKYIPALDGPPDASYPTLWRMDTHINQLWMGEIGEVYFGNPRQEDVSNFYARMTKILAGLPVQKVTLAIRLRGSSALRYDSYRRLK